MKAANGETIRIGVGLATDTATVDHDRFCALIDGLEHHGFDSIWFPERVAGQSLDPLVAMTWAAARTRKLKFGPSVMVVPGRNPVLLATALASLDRLSNGRLLPAFGLGAVNLGEHQAFGVDRTDRAPWFDEALPLLRRLWSEDRVDHRGERFQLEGVRVRPRPAQERLEVWLGGRAPSELRRTGRLGDGWLASFATPDGVAAAIPVIDEASERAGREPIDRGHFGVLLPYHAEGPLPDRLITALERLHPDAAPEAVVAVGPDALMERIEAFCEAGATKFVISPTVEPDEWAHGLSELAQAVLHLHEP